MANKTRSYRDMLLNTLADPTEAAHYLNAAIEDSHESFLKALKNVAQARQMARVARDAGVQRETLYRSLSDQGNPTLDTLSSILKAVGLKIFIGMEGADEPTPPIPATRASSTEGESTSGDLILSPSDQTNAYYMCGVSYGAKTFLSGSIQCVGWTSGTGHLDAGIAPSALAGSSFKAEQAIGLDCNVATNIGTVHITTATPSRQISRLIYNRAQDGFYGGGSSSTPSPQSYESVG
jgi:probable addiction module antidote protein